MFVCFIKHYPCFYFECILMYISVFKSNSWSLVHVTFIFILSFLYILLQQAKSRNPRNVVQNRDFKRLGDYSDCIFHCISRQKLVSLIEEHNALQEIMLVYCCFVTFFSFVWIVIVVIIYAYNYCKPLIWKNEH